MTRLDKAYFSPHSVSLTTTKALAEAKYYESVFPRNQYFYLVYERWWTWHPLCSNGRFSTRHALSLWVLIFEPQLFDNVRTWTELAGTIPTIMESFLRKDTHVLLPLSCDSLLKMPFYWLERLKSLDGLPSYIHVLILKYFLVKIAVRCFANVKIQTRYLCNDAFLCLPELAVTTHLSHCVYCKQDSLLSELLHSSSSF